MADIAANTILCEVIAKNSSFPIISEENKTIPYELRRGYDTVWILDPLDGTKEFLKRNDEFTINLALVKHGKPIFGVIYVPVTGEYYYAEKGKGSFSVIGAKKERMRVACFDKNAQNLKIACSRSHLSDETKAYLSEFDKPDLIERGSALKFAQVAKGEVVAYPRFAPTMEWDTAAGQIIVEEAGGAVLHAETGKPLVYNKENLLNPFFIAEGSIS
jgi:3'(2'), 5'-bisphosphate nucleotidase